MSKFWIGDSVSLPGIKFFGSAEVVGIAADIEAGECTYDLRVVFQDGRYGMMCDIPEREMSKVDPAVEAEPVVHAHWVKDPTMSDCYCGYYRCSRCHRMVPVSHGNSPEASYPYCNCGAKMDEEMGE